MVHLGTADIIIIAGNIGEGPDSAGQHKGYCTTTTMPFTILSFCRKPEMTRTRAEYIIMNDIISLNNIHFSAGKREILKGLSMTVRSGSAVTIMGPNGAGKTTLLKVVLGLVKPSEGEITLFGEKKLDRNLRKKLGYIPQNLALINEMSVISNIMMGAARRIPTWRSLIDLYPRHILEEAKGIMDMLEISRFEHTKVKMLSGGEKQRVAIARTMIQKPSIIIADEMTSSLDFNTALSVIDTLIGIKKKMDLTLLMTHHNPDIAKLSSDWIYIMRNGLILKEVPATEINRKSLVECYE